MPYFGELDRICEEKNWNKITIKVLRKWLLSILMFYKTNVDILNHFSVEEYIKYNFEKLKQTKDIKVLRLEEILNDPNCSLYKCIKKMPFNIDGLKTRFSKEKECFILDEHGEYYLSASGVCHGGETIELVDEIGLEHVLQHELQHIDQNYVYPSEFPFANDMLKMLYEGEGDYHYNLVDRFPNFSPIDTNDSYYIYYLVYTLLMLAIPKEMRDSWNKTDSIYPNSCVFSDIFKYISDSQVSINVFSQLFALATMIVASCNPENTKEIFDISVDTSLNRCSKKVDDYNQTIQFELESYRKNNLESQQLNIKFVKERINILQNPDLLQEKYLEIISDEKEFISSEPKEKQEELLQELQLFTLEKFESILKEGVKEGEESIRKYQNKKEKTPQEILGDEDYKRYQYYQFGMKLSKNMQVLLSQELTLTELFKQLLEKVESYLTESKDSRLEEKLAFIDEIIKNCLVNSKKIA